MKLSMIFINPKNQAISIRIAIRSFRKLAVLIIT